MLLSARPVLTQTFSFSGYSSQFPLTNTYGIISRKSSCKAGQDSGGCVDREEGRGRRRKNNEMPTN
jgi:hypothetical protein